MVDLTDRTDIPLTVDVDVPEMMAFEACLLVVRMVVRERSINRYTMDGTGGIDFMVKFCMLEG